MSTFAALREGLRRSLGAPRLLLLLWAVNLLAALPAAVVVGGSIHASVGRSLAHKNLERGFDTAWFGEYEAAARGLETTFQPTVTGAAAFFDNLEAWWSGRLFGGFPGLVGVGVLYALAWAFLLGGVLQWLSRPQGFEGALFSRSFFGEGGRFFFRFVRLTALAGLLYWGVYRLARLLFRALERASRDVTVEGTVLLRVLLGAALVVGLLSLVRLVFDYAKVATVAENRYGMLLAAWAGLRFVLRRPLRTVGLYVAVQAIWVLLLVLYALLAPGPGQSTWAGVIFAFLASQLWLMSKLALRVALLGGEVALYRTATPTAEG